MIFPYPPSERYVPGYDDDDEGIRIKGKHPGWVDYYRDEVMRDE